MNVPGLLRPNLQTGYLHAEASELDRKLREGDGVLWAGDPRLTLAMGTVTAKKRVWVDSLNRYVNKGEVVARRYEVWRWGEDGADHLIGTWRVEDFDRILFDMAPLRLDSPGHVDTLRQIDDHNEALAKAASDKVKESLMEGLEHQVRLWHDRENPRNRFYMSDIIPDATPTPPLAEPTAT